MIDDHYRTIPQPLPSSSASTRHQNTVKIIIPLIGMIITISSGTFKNAGHPQHGLRLRLEAHLQQLVLLRTAWRLAWTCAAIMVKWARRFT
jgi:hypothetical protein